MDHDSSKGRHAERVALKERGKLSSYF